MRLAHRLAHRLMGNALLALLVMTSLALPGLCLASKPAPYTDWAFDLKRAASDEVKLEALVRRSPHFARIWFYGHIFDLPTAGVADDVKATLRPKLEKVSVVLSSLDPPDEDARLYFDRAKAGTLTETTRMVREIEDELIDKVRASTPLSATMSPSVHPDLARAIFYRLLSRAEATRSRLGGAGDMGTIVATARHIALGFALAIDDLGPWSALIAWEGTPGVSVSEDQLVESLVSAGLNALSVSDPTLGRTRLQAALVAAREARGNSVYTALVLNGTANAAARGGHAEDARAIRQQVLALIRPLGNAGLMALVCDRLAVSHLAARQFNDLMIFTRELRTLGSPVDRTPTYLRNLLQAAIALRSGGDESAAAGMLSVARSNYSEALKLYDLLALPDIVGITEPALEVEPERQSRAVAAAELHRASARLDARLGHFIEAATALEPARLIYESLARHDGLAAVELELTDLALSRGELDLAVKLVQSAFEHATAGEPSLRARAYESRARTRLRRGEPAAAFANANDGLKLLLDTGDPGRFVVERAALHRLAALALDAGGLKDAAKARLDFAMSVNPSVETALLLAQLAVEAASPEAVTRALGSIPNAALDPRISAVYLGCALVRSGRAAEAITTLGPVLTLSAGAVRSHQVAGRTCLAAAHLQKGEAQTALNVILPARASAAELADPVLLWRVSAIDGEAALALGHSAAAAASWRDAVSRFADAGFDRGDRGLTLDARMPGPMASPDRAISGLPEAFLAAAAGVTGEEAAAHQLMALSSSVYAQQVQAMPEVLGLTMIDRRPPNEAAVRAAESRATAHRLSLRDGAIEGSDRRIATAAQVQAFLSLHAAWSAVRAEFPAYADWVLPMPPRNDELSPRAGEARYYVRLGAQASTGWLWIDGEVSPRVYTLPGRDVILPLVTAAIDVSSRPPKPWPTQRFARDPNVGDWKALLAPTKALLPFINDKKLDAALKDKTLKIYADGPLLRLPWGALIVGPPARKPGSPPVFLSTRFNVVSGLLPGSESPPRSTEVRATVWAVTGGPKPGGDCPPVTYGMVNVLYDLCEGADIGRETAAVTAAGGTAAVVTAAEIDAVSRGLAGATVFHFAGPVDTATGALHLKGQAPLEPLELGRLTAHADFALLTRLSAPAPALETGTGLLRLTAALRYAGLNHVAWLSWRNGADEDVSVIASLAAAVAAGQRLDTALHALVATRARGTTPPVAGSPPFFHPYFWARYNTLTP